MSYTKVRQYTTPELLKRVTKLDTFKGFPKDEFIIGVRSKENTKNVYDDKFYHYNGNLVCINVLTGTTNSGSYGFKNYLKWNSKGVAEIKANECYYNVWKPGLHKGKMQGLRQVGGFKVIRKKHENDSILFWTIEFNRGLNFHTNTYNKLSKVVKWFIGGWSVGCQVCNNPVDYYKSMKTLKKQKRITYFLIEEF